MILRGEALRSMAFTSKPGRIRDKAGNISPTDGIDWWMADSEGFIVLHQAEEPPGSMLCPLLFYEAKDPLEPGFRWPHSHGSMATNVCFSLLLHIMRIKESPTRYDMAITTPIILTVLADGRKRLNDKIRKQRKYKRKRKRKEKMILMALLWASVLQSLEPVLYCCICFVCFPRERRSRK